MIRLFQLAALFAVIALGGCAAILKGSKTSVSVAVPPQTQMNNYSGHDAEFSESSAGGVRELELESGESYLIEYRVGDHRDTARLFKELGIGYVAADIVLLYPVYPLVLSIDMAGPAYRFNTTSLAFRRPADSLVDSSAHGQLNVYDLYLATNRQPPQPKGYIGVFHMGAKFPFNQVPIFGNNIGVSGGYRFLPQLAVMGYLGLNGLMDYAPANSPLYMEANVVTLALESRYYLSKIFYASGGVEYLNISADTLWVTNPNRWRPIPGFSQSMFGASVGVGVAGPFAFFEVRHHWGFDPLHLPGGFESTVRNWAIRYGINIEF